MIDKKRMDLLLATAESMGLKPQQINDTGLVSIEANGKVHYLFHKTSNANTAMASWLSENKYISRLIFEKSGLPNIPFRLPLTSEAAKDFLIEHGRIIVKPLKGKKSQNIHLVESSDELEQLNLENCLLEKFIKGQETRFLVINGQVVAVHHKMYESDINNPDTVVRVSLHKDQWDERLVRLAIEAAQAIGLSFTAVDFLITEEGEAFLLEINSAPGLTRFQNPDQGPSVNAMRLYLEVMIEKLS